MSALMSPEFLFMVEPGPRGRTLTDHELATRLSYFLWSAPPDDELSGLAAKNALRPALAAQTKRMLADRRSDALLDRFTSEWLGLAKLSSQMPEPKLFPKFDEALRSAMAAEPRAFIGNLLRENRPIFDLLDSPYVFVNDRLATHYALPDVQGGDLRKVALTPEQQAKRGGLLTQAAFLTITSEQTRTSPVIRGKWILETLFNRPPPPPPPNVSGLTPDVSKAKGIVEHLRLHRTEPNCAGCHERIDPFGIALENFNAIGAWRDTEPAWEDPARPTKRDQYAKVPEYPIDTAFKLGGFEGSGVAGLKAYMQANRARFARGFTEKLAMYALGRPILLSDDKALNAIIDVAAKDDFRMQSLVTAIVQSPVFQSR